MDLQTGTGEQKRLSIIVSRIEDENKKDLLGNPLQGEPVEVGLILGLWGTITGQFINHEESWFSSGLCVQILCQ